MIKYKYGVVDETECVTPCPIGKMQNGDFHINMGSVSCQGCRSYKSITDGEMMCEAATVAGYFPCINCGEPAKGENELCAHCKGQ